MPSYHVIIGLKDRPEEDALETDKTEEYVRNKIAKPYLNGKKFACGGELVSPEDIETIRITKTDKPIVTGTYLEYTDLWSYADEGEDVTAEFLLRLARVSRSKSKQGVRRKKIKSNEVFIVHGRDLEPLKELKTILKEFGLIPIVLHEKPSGSRTIVEKLERYSDVGYVFVILTPDDRGGTFRGKVPVLGGMCWMIVIFVRVRMSSSNLVILLVNLGETAFVVCTQEMSSCLLTCMG